MVFKKLPVLFLIGFCVNVHGQKPPIDTSVYNNWPRVESPAIAANGLYVKYVIANQHTFNYTTILESLDKKWTCDLKGINNAELLATGIHAVYKNADSLIIITLGSGAKEFISGVSNYQIIGEGKDECLVYQLKNKSRELHIRNLFFDKRFFIPNVNKYFFNAKGTACCYEVFDTLAQKKMLLKLEIQNGRQKQIWSSGISEQGTIESLIYDNESSQIVFLYSSKNGSYPGSSFWHYSDDYPSAKKIFTDSSLTLNGTLQISRLLRFSKDKQRVFFNIRNRWGASAKSDMVKVTIWSYSDDKLQSQQIKETGEKEYLSVLTIQNGEMSRLQYDDEEMSLPDKKNDDTHLLVSEVRGDIGEVGWNGHSVRSVYLVSSVSGIRQKVKPKAQVSPNGKYLVYYDSEHKNYFSYDIERKVEKKITGAIHTRWTTFENDRVKSSETSYPVAGWVDDDFILLYDQNDIWLVDLSDKKPAINITKGIGRKRNIFFEILPAKSNRTAFRYGERIFLSSFNRETKENGFYSTQLCQNCPVKALSKGNYFYYAPLAAHRIAGGANFLPLKAVNSDVYLVRRMNARSSPNLFWTKDFISFTAVSNVYPEKEYNWMTSELCTWKNSRGQIIKGVLYKPENFDKKNKYPLIVTVYETRSNGYNYYIRPEPSGGELNVAWYVSNGYLVWAPDISYTIGESGSSALDDVTSGLAYLSKRSYVNTMKMGIQGISFGGFETNYIITHSSLFAAASSSSGISDMTSFYGSISERGNSMQGVNEAGQTRMGNDLWKIPQQYLKNSPVLYADKVTTPLLMMHTVNDGIVPFSQAVELFTGLRRLGKKVWMLEYGEGNHGLSGKSAADFSFRMQQFFDHYLKDKPAPIWMTRGIPAKLKGIETGLEYDTEIKTPGASPLLKKTR